MKKGFVFIIILFVCLFISIDLTAQETLVNTARNTDLPPIMIPKP